MWFKNFSVVIVMHCFILVLKLEAFIIKHYSGDQEQFYSEKDYHPFSEEMQFMILKKT